MRQFEGELENYVRYMWAKQGTDLLLSVDGPPMVRIDGDLAPIPEQPELTEATIQGFLVQILDPKQRVDLDTELDVDFALSWQSRGPLAGQRLLPAGRARRSALRLIPDDIPTFDELRLPAGGAPAGPAAPGPRAVHRPDRFGQVDDAWRRCIEWINEHRGGHIITIEDPIEYMHPKQAGGRSASARSASTRRRSSGRCASALREDPDVMLVGEMRDLEIDRHHADARRDRPPRAVDVAHQRRRAGPRPHRRRVPHRAPGADPRCSSPACSRPWWPSGSCRASAAAMVAAFEVLLGNTAVRNLLREGKTRQLRNVDDHGHRRGHADPRDVAV